MSYCAKVSLVLAGLAAWPVLAADSAPAYTAESIFNAATQTAGALAPNTIATVYGSNLAFTTRAVKSTDVKGGVLPSNMEGITVYVGGIAASLFYVSPAQINFLIPYELRAGTVTMVVARQGVAGPVVKLQLDATDPGMFQWDGGVRSAGIIRYAIASHLTGQVVGPDTPAAAGEIVVVYAVGLGRTSPDTTTGRVVSSVAPIAAMSQLQVTVGGLPVPAKDILYAGLAPGFAGLYQINLRLPATLPPDPEIRVSIGPQISPAQIRLPARATAISID